jgi:hypothetical protein
MPPTVQPQNVLSQPHEPNPSPCHHRETTSTPKARSPRAPTRTPNGVTRRTTSCNDRSSVMRHRVHNKASEWKRLGASEQVLGWIRRGVRIPFISGRRPPPFNNGTSMLDARQQLLDFMYIYTLYILHVHIYILCCFREITINSAHQFSGLLLCCRFLMSGVRVHVPECAVSTSHWDDVVIYEQILQEKLVKTTKEKEEKRGGEPRPEE